MPCKRESLHGVDGLFCFQRYVSCDELRNLVRKYALMDFNVYPQLARWWAEKSHHMYVEGPTEKFGHYVSNGTVGYTWYAYAIIFCFNIFAVITIDELRNLIMKCRWNGQLRNLVITFRGLNTWYIAYIRYHNCFNVILVMSWEISSQNAREWPTEKFGRSVFVILF